MIALALGQAVVLGGCCGDDGAKDVPEYDDSSMFRDVAGPIGEPCRTFNPEGAAELQGQAFGVTYPAKQKAVAFRPSRNGVIVLNDDIDFDYECDFPDYDLIMTFDIPKAKLGTYDYDPASVIFEIYVPQMGYIDATSGSLTLSGYDPTTDSLCGSFEANYDDGEGGRLSGWFKARVYCY